MMKMLAFVFSVTIFAVILTQDASALRGAGIRAGAVGARGVSVGAYRGGLRARNVGYRAAALGGRRHWRGGRRYGYGAGLGALAGAAYYYNSPYYGYSYASPYYGYSSYRYPRYRSAYAGSYGYSSGVDASGSAGATAAKLAATGPGMCGTYLYWKNGKCNDARSKS